MSKPTVVYPHNGILLSNKKECATDTQKNSRGPQGFMLSEKKPVSKGYILKMMGVLMSLSVVIISLSKHTSNHHRYALNISNFCQPSVNKTEG